MYIESAASPISSSRVRIDSVQFRQNRETFHDVFQRTLKSQSGSRPPKIELTGVLVPCGTIVQGYQCRFKLETHLKEYFLRMSDSLSSVAKKAEWEEVSVRGVLDPDSDFFEVEKISLVQRSEPFSRITTELREFYSDLDQYKRTIANRGKLELSHEYIAS